MKLKLESKAQTLENLKEVISAAKVLPIIKFSYKEYLLQKEDLLKKCLTTFDSKLIVRSSSTQEDGLNNSNAGSFDSVLNVKNNKEELDSAILTVFSSFNNTTLLEDDEVFIQPMLENVTLSGVVFTADIDTLAPYYIINYDESGSTTSVTSGTGEHLKTFISFKGKTICDDDNLKRIITASQECEKLFENPFLDIEFAIQNENLYILQVRAIVTKGKKNLSDIDLNKGLFKLYKKIEKLNTLHPKLLGHKSIFGVMPDWNPAEIIGIKPKRLALSLYKELITDEIWAYQRDNYGYRNLRSFPLLVSFLGIPYIDVRVSFNSFIPKNLHESISLKLVSHYLEELSNETTYHDKIEFEIVYSCYFFGISKKLQKLKQKNFSNNEIKRLEFELLNITNNVIDIKEGLYKQDLQKINLLEEKFDDIVNSKLSLIDKIYWLIEDCKRFGTLPFAGIARAAFIAIQFLNSFVEEQILTQEEVSHYLNNIESISKQLSKDIQNISKDDFLAKYGHLRPGTYDICSLRYDEAYEKYFSEFSSINDTEPFTFTNNQQEKINQLLIENGIHSNFNELITFIKESIEGREYAKFIFTKHLSKTLQLIEELGNKFDISRDELAHLDIQQIKNLYAFVDDSEVKELFESNIEKNKHFYTFTNALKLPSLITSEKDIYSFYLKAEEPNFITLNKISAPVIDLSNNHEAILENKIICVQSADPGYDFLFSKNIAGLITCFGGANSHMAIRCAELGIPAVIGCGATNFGIYKKAQVIEINALNKQVKVIT